jgi:hypothetical protein
MIRAMFIVAALSAGSWGTLADATAAKSSATASCCGAYCSTCCGEFCDLCCGDACAACCGPECCGGGCCGASFISAAADKPAAADEKPAAKEVKLSGTMVCGACALDITKKCSNVVQVKEGGKLVNYILDDKGNQEKYHEGVCGGGKIEGVTVTGTVSEKDGQKYIKPSKVDIKK